MADPRPRDDRDAAQDLARELADLAAQLASLKGEAYNWPSDESYDALRHRLEDAHASVEAEEVLRHDFRVTVQNLQAQGIEVPEAKQDQGIKVPG